MIAAPSVTTGSCTTKVTIDGADQTVEGTVVCAAMGGNVNIAIGEATTGIAAVISEGDAPTVTSVGLGNVNGVNLGYAGVPAANPRPKRTATPTGSAGPPRASAWPTR